MKRTLKSVLLGSLIGLTLCAGAFAQSQDLQPENLPSQEFLAGYFIDRAQEAERRGDTISASQLYQSAIIHGSATIEPYLGIAEFYSGTDQPNLAEKYYNIALELDPANPTALKGLALIALAEGDVEAAQARHEILIEACAPECPEAAELRDAIAAHGSSAMAVH